MKARKGVDFAFVRDSAIVEREMSNPGDSGNKLAPKDDRLNGNNDINERPAQGQPSGEGSQQEATGNFSIPGTAGQSVHADQNHNASNNRLVRYNDRGPTYVNGQRPYASVPPSSRHPGILQEFQKFREESKKDMEELSTKIDKTADAVKKLTSKVKKALKGTTSWVHAGNVYHEAGKAQKEQMEMVGQQLAAVLEDFKTRLNGCQPPSKMDTSHENATSSGEDVDPNVGPSGTQGERISDQGEDAVDEDQGQDTTKTAHAESDALGGKPSVQEIKEELKKEFEQKLKEYWRRCKDTMSDEWNELKNIPWKQEQKLKQRLTLQDCVEEIILKQENMGYLPNNFYVDTAQESDMITLFAIYLALRNKRSRTKRGDIKYNRVWRAAGGTNPKKEQSSSLFKKFVSNILEHPFESNSDLREWDKKNEKSVEHINELQANESNIPSACSDKGEPSGSKPRDSAAKRKLENLTCQDAGATTPNTRWSKPCTISGHEVDLNKIVDFLAEKNIENLDNVSVNGKITNTKKEIWEWIMVSIGLPPGVGRDRASRLQDIYINRGIKTKVQGKIQQKKDDKRKGKRPKE